MRAALRTRLKGNTSAGERVDWGLRIQGKPLPAVRLTNISTPKAYTMAGPMGTQQFRVQVDCYGSDYKAAHDLGDAVIALLEPGSGSFQDSFVLSDIDLQDDTDTGIVFRRSIDFRVTYVSA
jgi:hypothetical protein